MVLGRHGCHRGRGRVAAAKGSRRKPRPFALVLISIAKSAPKINLLEVIIIYIYIGYDVGETSRRENVREQDEADPKYTKIYALMDWGWTREDCVAAIQRAGLPLPGKSSCFFCPSMKKKEIRTLYHRHRDLYERAIAIEDGAKPNLVTVQGLGRSWAWRDFVTADLNQQAMCWMFPEDDLPCNCHDGG